MTLEETERLVLRVRSVRTELVLVDSECLSCVGQVDWTLAQAALQMAEGHLQRLLYRQRRELGTRD